MSDLLAAIIGDILPPGLPMQGSVIAAGNTVLRRLLHARVEAAREIFVRELELGNQKLSDLPEEELAAVFFRYAQAAMQGEARVNLRLLSAVAAGQARQEGLYADEFLRWATVLSGLRREELLVLGEFVRTAQSGGATPTVPVPREDEAAAAVALWTKTVGELKSRQGLDEPTVR